MSNAGNLCGANIRRAEIAEFNPNIAGLGTTYEKLRSDILVTAQVNLTGVTGDKIDQQYDTRKQNFCGCL